MTYLDRKSFLFALFILLSGVVTAQNNSYISQLRAHQKTYIDSHGVVKGADRQYLRFYPINKKFRLLAKFERIADTIGFDMNTSSGMIKKYVKYGKLTFTVNDTVSELFVYQSRDLMVKKKYKDHLFIPFGDKTSGIDSYGGGRYLDAMIPDIRNGKVVLDFNKAYNPYCTYTTGYNCPIPPAENLLKVAIPAGERNYSKPVR